jgi:type VI secretion system protein VasG
LTYDDKVVKLTTSRCTERESGGWRIDAILTNTLLPRISHEILVPLGEGWPINQIAMSALGDVFEHRFG